MSRNYTTRLGLPSNEVYETIQDSRGYMWFATSAGVSKFDGQSFKNFNIENGLGENSILGIYEDYRGRIWCRGISGSLSYIENDSSIILEAQVKNYYPNSLFVDQNDVVWVGSQMSGIYYNIKPPYATADVVAITDSLTDIHITRSINGSIYSRNTSINKPSIIRDFQTGSEVPFEMPPSSSGIRVVTHHNITIVCEGNQVFKIDENLKVENFEMPFTVKNAYVDNEENIWLCLDAGEGVALYKNGNLNIIPEIYFENTTISSVVQDIEGAYWFSSISSGVKYVATLKMIEYDLQLLYNGEPLIFLNTHSCLVASNYSGKFNIIRGEEHYISTDGDYLKNPQSLPKGLGVTFKNKKHFEHKNQTSILKTPSPDFHFLLEDDALIFKRNDTHYWGNTTLFCFKADKKNRTITDTYASPSRINASCLLGDSLLLLACNDGLWSFANGNYTDLNKKFPVLKQRLNDIKADDQGRLWIASSRSGVFLIENNSIKQFNRTLGLSSNICNHILIVEDSTFVGTNNGLSLISPNKIGQYQCAAVTLKSSLPSTAIKKIFKVGSGLHILTDDRLIWFEDAKPERTNQGPRTYINNITVNNTRILEYQNLILDYNQNDINISVIGISYIQPEQNHYKYKLAEIDTGWHYSNSSQIQYPALPPGKYTLTVLAINSLGVVSIHPATFSFVIKAPYWKTWWFMLFIAIMLGSLIWLLLWRRLTRIRKATEEKEKQNAQIARIEMKALRAQMNPHFIFNCINAIQHYILENDKLTANKLLSRFSRLVRNVLENSNCEWINIKREIETLELYIEMELLRFDSKFSVNINIASDIDTLLDQIPPLTIQPFVENAIIHGLLPLDNRTGNLDIQLLKESNSIVCIIDDNGIGRKKAEAIKASKNQTYQSLGISITEERLQIYNQTGKHNQQMKLKIEDKITVDQKPLGTRVTLILPCQSITS